MLFWKPKSFLGIDVGAGGVKIVELKKEKGRPVLFTYGLTSESSQIHQVAYSRDKTTKDLISESPAHEGKAMAPAITISDSEVEKYANLIKTVCAKSKTKSKTAVVSLPISAVFHALVTLPMVKKEEFKSILNAEIKKLLPYPLEDMVIDSQVLPSDKTDSEQVLVHAVPRELIVFYGKVFAKAGLKLDSLEPESTALARALIGRDTATTMLVDIGAERTNFFIVDKMVPLTHNSIELGGDRINKVLSDALGIEPALLERLKRDLFRYLAEENDPSLNREVFLNVFQIIVDPIIKEIEFSFDLFLRQNGNVGKRPEKIVLTGGGALFPFLTEYISEKFKMKCYVGDPWGRVVYQDSLKPILHAVGPRVAVAIGLALRNVV